MDQGSVFQSNRSQAVRLPKAAALPDDVKRVDVVAIGRTRILTPAGESWSSWFEGDEVTADFMAEREEPLDQGREGFDAQIIARHQGLHLRDKEQTTRREGDV